MHKRRERKSGAETTSYIHDRGQGTISTTVPATPSKRGAGVRRLPNVKNFELSDLHDEKGRSSPRDQTSKI